MAEQTGGATDLHALLIGIDFYLLNAIPGAGTYPSLAGCVRDVDACTSCVLPAGGNPDVTR